MITQNQEDIFTEKQPVMGDFRAILNGIVARGELGAQARRGFTFCRWSSALTISVVVMMAVGSSRADAATRFAAPDGNGPYPCLKSDPCSLFLAASNEAPGSGRAQSGDEVIVLPGEYSGVKGDLGPEERIQLSVGVDIHGESGQPRPVISAARTSVVLSLNGDSTASNLELIAPQSRIPLLVLQSIAQGLVVRTSAEEGIACTLGFRAILRDSVCIAAGEKGAGAGQQVHTNSFPMHTRTLRNVTAIGTGPESRGILFDISGGEVFIDVKSSIAKGTAIDVEARGEEPGGGSTLTLEASSYATAKAVEEDGGLASVTEPGTNGNIIAAPLLAVDGFHQLPGSPTIDKGTVDLSSGLSDIDGDARVIAAGSDIGADEMVLATATSLLCSPATLTFGQESVCTTTVHAQDGGAPTGSVDIATANGMEFGSCELKPSGSNQANCELRFPVLIASPDLQVTAAYRGDPSHASSQGSFHLSIAPQISLSVPVLTNQENAQPPNTLLKRKPPRRSDRQTAIFAFASTYADSSFQCKLDGRRYRQCRSPIKFEVGKGRHVFRVQAVGAVGADPTPAIFRWSVTD